MADKQYDVSPEMQRLFEIKQKQRAEIKSYYKRLVNNPHRPIGDGQMFDPVLFRFNALTHYSSEYFRPNVRTGVLFFFLMALPLAGHSALICWERSNRERKINSGEIPYELRMCKLMQ